MVVVIGIAIVVLAVAATIWMSMIRRPRLDAGIVGFRKHIDALSPESRREVQDRVRGQQDRAEITNDVRDVPDVKDVDNVKGVDTITGVDGVEGEQP